MAGHNNAIVASNNAGRDNQYCQDFSRSAESSRVMPALYTLHDSIIYHYSFDTDARIQRIHFDMYRPLISNYCLYICTVAPACHTQLNSTFIKDNCSPKAGFKIKINKHTTQGTCHVCLFFFYFF